MPRLATAALTLAIAPFFLAAPASAQAIHALIVADTDEPGRQVDRTATYEVLMDAAERAAQYSGLELIDRSLHGRAFNYDSVVRAMENLTCGPDDVVFFAFEGHGSNARGSVYPALYFPHSNRDITFDWMVDQIRRCNPRLIVALSGSCNSGPALPIADPPQLFSRDFVAPEGSPEIYRALFADARGEVLGTAASPGEVSWSYTSKGNVYLLAFVQNLRDMTTADSTPVDWDTIMHAAYADSIDLTSGFESLQNSVWEVNLWDVPPEPARPMTLDVSLPANYGGVRLTAGFPEDPHIVTVAAGGSEDAGTASQCPGFVSAAPDYELTYTASPQFGELNIYARSKADTMLVVNTPSGQWICNDDHVGLDPLISLQRPESGVYDIWVGTYGPDASNPPANLYISELPAQF